MTEKILTFAKYYQTWFETYREPKIRDVTATRYLIALKQLEESQLGKMDVKKITRKHVQDFFNEYGKTRRRKTVLDMKTILNAGFADAVQDRLIKNNPCARIEIVSIEDKWTVEQRKAIRETKKWLEFDEYKKLRMYLIGLLQQTLSQAPSEPLQIKNKLGEEICTFTNRGHPIQMSLIVIYIALKTGARYSEIIGITKKDLDFEKKFMNIDKSWDYKHTSDFAPTKNLASIRKVYVDQEFCIIIQQYLEWLKKYEIRIAKGAILVREKAKSYNSSINHILKNIFTAIEVEPISLHKLRHTHASILIAQKVSLQVVAKRLGHTDTSMIQQTYGHLLQSVEKDETERILELI